MDQNAVGNVLPRLYIAPSAFASHFHFGCDRQLIFSAAHIDRARWLYKDEKSNQYRAFDREATVQLETARQSGMEAVKLFDGSSVDLKARSLSRAGVSMTILRSNWAIERESTVEGRLTTTRTPLSEDICATLDDSLSMPERPVELTIEGLPYVAFLNTMMVSRRYIGEEVPKDAKPQKLSKWTLQELERDALSVAFTSGGDVWESDILNILATKDAKVHMGDLPEGAEDRASDRKLSQGKFIAILSQPASSPSTTHQFREFVYQPALESPKELYEMLGLQKKRVTFSRCFPDFIEVHRAQGTSSTNNSPSTSESTSYTSTSTNSPAPTAHVELTIVDAKATDHMKLSHRIQVAIYYFIIESLIKANNLSEKVKLRTTGGVWLRGRNDYDTFDLAPVISYLRDFFKQGQWKRLTETPLLSVQPQMSKKCLNCNFLNFCKGEASTHKRELSLIYGVTPYDKTYIRNFVAQQGHVQPSEAAELDIEQLHDYLDLHQRERLSTNAPAAAKAPIDSEATVDALPTTPKRRSSSLLGIRTPSTPSAAPSSPSTPLRTPNSSQALLSLEEMTPTKPEAPVSPYPVRSGSSLTIGDESQSQLPIHTQPLEDASFGFDVPILSASTRLKPLNRDIWISLMKMKSFLKQSPVVLHQPTSQLSTGDDLSAFISILWDRPNAHMLGWSLSARFSSKQLTNAHQASLLERMRLLNLSNVQLPTDMSRGLHCTSILGSKMTSADPRVASLVDSLIVTVHCLLSYAATELPAKATFKLHTFTPSEAELLAQVFSQKARSVRFQPVNSRHNGAGGYDNGHENMGTAFSNEIGAMAIRIFTALFHQPESVALSHQESITAATSGYLHVLRPTISSMLALPLTFDADLDDFHAAMCRTSLDNPSNASNSDVYSNKGLLKFWYSLVGTKTEPENEATAIASQFNGLLVKRAQMSFEILDSLRYLVSGVQSEHMVKEGEFEPVSSLEGPSSLTLLCAPSRPFKWPGFVPTCDEAISKLLYSDSIDVWIDAKQKMSARTSIAFRQAFQVEDRVLAMKMTGSYEITKRATHQISIFEFDYMSESMASALKQDIDDHKTDRWILCANTDSSVASMLAFDDFKHSYACTFAAAKFVPPSALAFGIPQKLCTSSSGKRELHLKVKPGKTMAPPVIGGVYFLSEFVVDLTSEILRNCLYSLDLRIGFINALVSLRDSPFKDSADKERINKFLLEWIRRAQSDTSDPKVAAFWIGLDDQELFDRMGGLQAFFLEKIEQSESHSQVRVQFNAAGKKMKFIGTSLAWAIEEHMGIERAGTTVPRALMHDPVAWASCTPGDFSDQTPGITRSLALSELFVHSGMLTSAQNDILQAVLRQKLTCVWGPPGTGKTHFLAHLILLLLESHREMVEKEVEISYIDGMTNTAETKKKRAKATGKASSAKKSSSSRSLPPTSSSAPSSNGELLDGAEEEELARAIAESLAINPPSATMPPQNSENGQSGQAISSSSPSGSSTPPDIPNSSIPVGSPYSSTTPLSEGATESTPAVAISVATSISETHPSTSEIGSEPKTMKEKRIVSAGAPFCVMVVSFTHRAIDNLLERFIAVDDQFRAALGSTGAHGPGAISTTPLPVARLFSDSKQSATNERIESLNTAAKLSSFMQCNSQCVIGATVWALRKHSLPSTAFDVLIIDEASQVLLSQAVVASQWLLPGGRMVVAGDHEQLPPITNIEFADRDGDQSGALSKAYSKSVFEYLQHRDREEGSKMGAKSLTHMLYENWRSCDALNDLSSRTIYLSRDESKRYRPANELTAQRQFWLAPEPEEDRLPGQPAMFNWTIPPTRLQGSPEIAKLPVPIAHPLLQLMFDATRPFGVVFLRTPTDSSGQSSVSLDSFPQAKLIACLMSAVRHVASVLNPTETDQSFWSSRLLVVAPHHAQRHRIREEMLNPMPNWSRKWDTEVSPSIDTVEKAQGRQFESVIVDYGIINEYRIAKELSFLYSRNRINVSQTRAESKCLFFVSEAMLKMTPHIYQSKRTADGFSYLQHLVTWARHSKSVIDVEIDQIDAICADLDSDPFFPFLAEHQPPSTPYLFETLSLK